MNNKGRVFLKRKEVTNEDEHEQKEDKKDKDVKYSSILITIHEQVMKKDKDQVMKNKDRNTGDEE